MNADTETIQSLERELKQVEETREKWMSRALEAEERAKRAEAERDAALAAIERLRSGLESASYYEYKPHKASSDLIWAIGEINAALDGAPEPECRWEYRGRLQSCGYVAEGYISAEHAMNGLKVELEDHPFLVMDDTAIVERARVREWLPVEGEMP